MPQIDKPDFQDADLVIKLYDLRREAVMRQSRQDINQKFWPKSFEDVMAITNPEHELNAAFRQTSTYWEMVYGMAKHGISCPNYLAENNAEGFFLYAKMIPYLEKFRAEVSPRAFCNAQWICENSETAKDFLAWFTKKIEKKNESS